MTRTTALVFALLFSLPAAAANAIYFQSQPGDPVMNGASGVELVGPSSDVTYNVGGTGFGGVGIQARVISTNQQWYLGFAPVGSDGLLQPGVYENAVKVGTLAGFPTIDVYRSPVNCLNGFGRFTVLEIEYGPSNVVNKVAIDFEWHCAGADPALFGGVRYNSAVPYVQKVIDPLQLTPASIYLSSTADDPILHGQRFTITNAAGLVRRMMNSPQGARITVGPGTEPPDWEFGIVMSGPLAPGSYTVGFSGPSAWMNHGGKQCGGVGTRVTVHEVEVFGPVIRKLAADIAYSCDGKTVTSYAGIRYNSSLPYVDPTVTPPAPVVTTATGTSPQGGAIKLTMVAATPECSLSRTSFIDPATISPPVAPPPEGIAGPHGLVEFATQNCAPGSATRFDIDFPQALPPTAQWWVYGQTLANRTPHWFAIPSTITGNRISFSILDGADGDTDITSNGAIVSLAMLAVPGGVTQDLWWSGLAENGWGMSIVQHRDLLFANMFVYDASGAPIWYVMPSGSWNSDHTIYTGDLYLPKGSPFYQYDGTKFDIGASVGTATLTFADVNNASFDYTINGTTGHKNITRILFGPQSPPTDKPLGDLWWAGSAQNGWGLAILQQYSSLFALWFTYDASGKPTWFVMPGGSWVAKDDYQGKIYRAEGPPWLGVTYDASRHKLTEIGSFRFRVNGEGATFDYTADGRSGSINVSRIPF